MPTDETPSTHKQPDQFEPGQPELSQPEPHQPAEVSPDAGALAVAEKGREESSASPAASSSRWVDYDTHELLQMISDLEDERRWARLREGVWIAILFHLLLLSAITWIPKYVFNQPRVIDPLDALKQRKDLTYLDVPPDALRKLQPKVEIKPVPQKPTVIDKKTLEAMNRPAARAPEPTPAPQAPPQSPVQPPPPMPSTQQSQVEAPHPAAVPARPNFAPSSQSPGDQLRDAMKGAAHNPGFGAGRGGTGGGGGLSRHPGAGTGGVEVLSDTQGVDFNSWLAYWHRETLHTWDPLIPDEVNPPIRKQGQLIIRFKVLPNGRLMEGSMALEGSSGDVALDRAAWGALTGSNYPQLPRDFHGPFLELRAWFLYNMEPPK
jgi:outer membrane biosynthesis protein TonB